MTFLIHGLEADLFRSLFSMSDTELNKQQAVRHQVASKPGFPCRISLSDAEIGEKVILIHYAHQPEDTPYRASHAIYIRENVQTAHLKPGEIPADLTSRLLSVRAFDRHHLMTNADVVEGKTLKTKLEQMFADSNVDYIHIHNAKPGCFAAKAIRAC